MLESTTANLAPITVPSYERHKLSRPRSFFSFNSFAVVTRSDIRSSIRSNGFSIRSSFHGRARCSLGGGDIIRIGNRRHRRFVALRNYKCMGQPAQRENCCEKASDAQAAEPRTTLGRAEQLEQAWQSHRHSPISRRADTVAMHNRQSSSAPA